MKNLLTASLLLCLIGLLLFSSMPAPAAPRAPDAGANAQAAQAHFPERYPDGYPTRVVAPSIGLDAPVIPVGQNDEGEMEVPDGNGDAVGWYKNGTVPGEKGSAVLAAHVYAAFETLRYLKRGEDIFIVSEDGERLRFVVEESKITTLEETSPYFLFERDDAKRLNLITCAGSFDREKNTYSDRLTVYARLVEE